MSREALVLLVCCCDFRDGAERLIPSKSLRNAVIRAFPGLFRILRMCAPRRAVAVVRPRGREKSADRRRRILISRLLIIRASVPRRKSPFPAYFKGFPAVSPLIPPYPAFLKYPVSPQLFYGRDCGGKPLRRTFVCNPFFASQKGAQGLFWGFSGRFDAFQGPFTQNCSTFAAVRGILQAQSSALFNMPFP